MNDICAAPDILGIIVADSYLADQPDILTAIENKPLPSVWVASGEQGGIRKNVIDIDDEKAAFELANLLLESGCRNPVFMAPNLDTIARRKRLQGFKRALQAAGRSFDDRCVLFSTGRLVMKDWGRDCAGLCLSRRLSPDGLFMTDFELLDGVVEYLTECGQEEWWRNWHCVAFDCEPTYHPSLVATVCNQSSKSALPPSKPCWRTTRNSRRNHHCNGFRYKSKNGHDCSRKRGHERNMNSTCFPPKRPYRLGGARYRKLSVPWRLRPEEQYLH